MTDSSNSQSHSAWVQSILAELLVAPHISFHGPPGIRLGHGPIDVFSTKFNNTFTPDAKGVVAGERVDREGLKEKLLALQRHYSPDKAKFRSQEPTGDAVGDQRGPGEVRVSFTGDSKDIGEFEVSTAAAVVGKEGVNKISSLTLDGKPELFVKHTV